MLRSSHSPHLPTQRLCLFSFQNSCGNCICYSVCHPTCQISLSCFTQRRSLFASHLSIPSTLLCHSHSGNITVFENHRKSLIQYCELWLHFIKNAKNGQFGEFLKTWSLQSNSATGQVTFKRTKIGGKCQHWKFKLKIKLKIQL